MSVVSDGRGYIPSFSPSLTRCKVLPNWSAVIEQRNVLAGRRIIRPTHQPGNSRAQGLERQVILSI